MYLYALKHKLTHHTFSLVLLHKLERKTHKHIPCISIVSKVIETIITKYFVGDRKMCLCMTSFTGFVPKPTVMACQKAVWTFNDKKKH